MDTKDFETAHPRETDGRFATKAHDEQAQGVEALQTSEGHESSHDPQETRQRAVEELAEEMNCWYGCAAQATVIYAEETLNHPDDPDAVLAATRERYETHPSRKDDLWRDELAPDEAMACARDSVLTLADGDLYRGVFSNGFGEMPHLNKQVPTGDRVAAARLIIDASKPEARTW